MSRIHPAVALLFASRLMAQTDPVALSDPTGCAMPLVSPTVCTEGSIGDESPREFSALGKDEVEAIVKAAAAAINTDHATIAVVDRAGRPLAVFRQSGARASNDDQALGLARAAALFSNDQAPLSSRTVRFIGEQHFPAGVVNAPVAALYGIEQSNRGCELNFAWNEGKCMPRAKSIAGGRCTPADGVGCGQGVVTGKQFGEPAGTSPSVNAGGIPLFRLIAPGLDRAGEGVVTHGRLIGGVGVAGIEGDPQLAEYAAVTGAFGSAGIIPLPSFPLPEPQNVLLDGIRLPFLGADLKLKFNGNGLPIGLEPPAGISAGTTVGTFVYGPAPGGCASNGYLVGPNAGTFLSKEDVDAIVQRAIQTARRTRAQIRLPLNSYARMVISIADVDGRILASFRMPDAVMFSLDVATAKARNMVYFNGIDPAVRNDLPGIPAGTYVTARTIGFGAQPLFPPGIDSRSFRVRQGPWYSSLYLFSLSHPCAQGTQAPGPDQSGLIFFAGSSPLVRSGVLVGGLGVSGDGIEQDDYVTFFGAGDLLPPREKWADQIKIDGVRLPMFKFPRHPEGVTECGGNPCK